MKINKVILGLTFLTLVGVFLSACASTAGTEAGDQVSQPDSAEKTLYVGPILVDCQGEGPQKCMLVRESPEDEFTLFYDQIEGFDYEEGYEYKIVVKEENVEDPPAGGSSLKYSLVSVESKEPVPIAEEVVEKIIYVGSELVDCVGVAPQKCMLIKEKPDDEYTFFYDQIEGFEYEEGYEYELVIKEEQVENPPADASSIKWTLVSVESKEPVAGTDEVQLENADWVLASYLTLGGVVAEPLPGTNTTARFQDGQVNGNAGCNNYFGGYEVDGNILSVGPLASTEMFCGNPQGVMDQEYAYLAALGNAAFFEIDGEQLEIADSDGESVLIYNVAEPTSLTGNLWQVLSYNNGKEAVVSVIIGTELTAVFDEEGQLSGSAGCNNYSAAYEVEGEMINIGPAITTRMACSDPEAIMEQEMEYLAALEMASSYQFEDDRLILLDSEGRRVVNYQLGRTFELSETIWYLQNYFDGSEAILATLDGTEITAYFNEDGSLSGSAGCNNYSGIYQVDGDMIEIELGPLTMMFCEEPEGAMDQEAAYLKALDSVTSYRILGDVMVMEDDSGQEVLKFKASDLVGYVWMWLEFLENNDTITQPDIPGNYTLEFLPDGVVNLQADCNNASGSYNVKGSQLDIEIIITTMAACPPESLSDEYIQLLNDAVAFIRQGEVLFIDIMMDAGTMRFFPQ
jgi:heat shock protein HslJ